MLAGTLLSELSSKKALLCSVLRCDKFVLPLEICDGERYSKAIVE